MIDNAANSKPPEFNAEKIANEIVENQEKLLPIHEPYRYAKDPQLIIKKWMRFPEKIDFKKANLSLISGPRGQGKSALIEVLAWLYIKLHGAKGIIDLFSARDGEGLAFIRNKKLGDSVLLIHGDCTKIACEYDTIPVSKVTLDKLLQYKLVVTVPKFYRNPTEEFEALGRMLRLMWDRDYWAQGDLRVLNLREGINIGSSRLSLGEKSNQSDAKAQFIYALNQFRHAGFAVNLDCLRLKSIDINIREIADFIFLKHQGIFGPSEDLRFLFKKYDLIRDFMRLPKYGFVIVSIQGGYGHGVFQRPYWHKETNENIREIVGITDIRYEDQPVEQSPQGAMSDFDHVKIVELRLEKNAKGKLRGVHQISEEMHISSATAANHIKYHNTTIANLGECDKCKRAKSNKSKTVLMKSTAYLNPNRTSASAPVEQPKVDNPVEFKSINKLTQEQSPTKEEAKEIAESIIDSTLPAQDKEILKEIVKSKTKSDIAHEDEANMESNASWTVG